MLFEYRFCPKAIICIISNPVSFFANILFYSWVKNKAVYVIITWLCFTHRWTLLSQLQVKCSKKLEFMIQLGKTVCLYIMSQLPRLYKFLTDWVWGLYCKLWTKFFLLQFMLQVPKNEEPQLLVWAEKTVLIRHLVYLCYVSDECREWFLFTPRGSKWLMNMESKTSQFKTVLSLEGILIHKFK